MVAKLDRPELPFDAELVHTAVAERQITRTKLKKHVHQAHHE